MTGFIDGHRAAYGGGRSAGFCRLPHPPHTPMPSNGLIPPNDQLGPSAI